jgi:hypothetical protein
MQIPNRQHLQVGMHMAVAPSEAPWQAGHVAGLQPPLAEPPLEELAEPPELDEPVHEPALHVPLGVQSAHIPPAEPQSASSVPGWHIPVGSQQPMVHDVESQEAVPPPLVLLPPPLVLLPPPLVLLPPPLVLLPLPPPLLPLELPLLFEEPLPPSTGPSPGPLVAHAEKSAPTESKTIPAAARRWRECIILSVYLTALPLQGGAGPHVRRRRARDCSPRLTKRLAKPV